MPIIYSSNLKTVIIVIMALNGGGTYGSVHACIMTSWGICGLSSDNNNLTVIKDRGCFTWETF